MRETIKNGFNTVYSTIRTNSISIVSILLALLVLTAPAIAQDQISRTDDFEDQNADGWEGQNINVEATNGPGDYSLVATDGFGSQEDNPEWVSGPTLDLTEQFTVSGTSKVQPQDLRSGFGIVRPNETADNAEGVILLFSGEFDQTFIARFNGENPPGLDTINTDYDNEWVNWELESDGGGNVTATVWSTSETKSEGDTISRQLDPDSGKFSIFSGVAPVGRVVSLDSVTASGTTVTSPNLVIGSDNYIPYGETTDYTVYNLEGGNDRRIDVTENATVTSANTSVVTVDESKRELTATADESVNTRVPISAEYEGQFQTKEITVASPTVDNLDVLPFLWRISAMFQDRAFQMILVGLLLSIAATRTASAFAGIGVYQMVLTAGWLIGWVPIGLALVSLFSSLFIGLNIAANIDYTVRR